MGIDAGFHREVDGKHVDIKVPYDENDPLKVGCWEPGYFRNPGNMGYLLNKVGINIDIHGIWGDWARDVCFQPDEGWQSVYDTLFTHAIQATRNLEANPDLLDPHDTAVLEWELFCMLETAKYLASLPDQASIYGCWG